MCGIFGVLVKEGASYSPGFIEKLTRSVATYSESRGKDSSGLAFRDQSGRKVEVFKGPIEIRELLRDQRINTAFRRETSKELREPFAVLGHARLVTNGNQLLSINNQPVVRDGIVTIHNGIVTNVDEMWANTPGVERLFEIDTEVIPARFRHFDNPDKPLGTALSETLQGIKGTMAIAMMFAYRKDFLLFTNNGSLYVLTNHKDLLVFASEHYILSKVLEDNKLKEHPGEWSLLQLPARKALNIDLDSFGLEYCDFDKLVGWNPHPQAWHTEEWQVPVNEVGQDRENRSVVYDVEEFGTSSQAAREIAMLEYHEEAIRNLKRCTKCVLPETFPFIEFDNQGVCNYCNNYVPKSKPHNLGELQKLVEPYRRKDKQPDCIIPFSGGRDSTFTLHMAKEELGLNPIAYTYDWGMVTDLARRNIARICGQLGVENIIVAADIRMKRSNIRKNIKAWLKYPQLGMIPLFMAGDKYFFYYCNELKKQTGIDLNIWGINYLENTDFKTGFAGVAPNFHKERIYDLRLGDQAKLFGFVANNFLHSPSYFNSSMVDTLGSFAARYIAPKKDYYHFFDFYPWEEQEIESLILNTYDWEIAHDTKTTWRIGDGTASFYNYIYVTVAGFSEADTFRSNQIREGMMTREQALDKIFDENRPRYDTLRWYLEIVGLDFEPVVKTINAIPKRYTP